jgi:iron complex outermembrane receptor protein
MRNRYLFGASCIALAVCGRAMAQSLDQKPDTVTKPVPSTQVGEVVVTASRRSENIIKVPVAVSAYSPAKLRDEQLVSLTDLTALTPNMQISVLGDKVNINIRGIGNGNLSVAGGEPGVAVTSDGVYLGQTALALRTFLDLSQVEVLRGPQGTLFGRNATGGAVNLIPNTPTKDLSYGADLSVGPDPTIVRSSAYVSGPLNAGGTLLGRLSAEQNYNEGYTRNLNSGPGCTGPCGPSHLDGVSDAAVRGQLEWQPTSNFDVRLLAEYRKENDAGPAVFLLGDPANVPYATPFGPAPIQGANPGNPEDRTIHVNYGSEKLTAETVDLHADWQVGGGDLKAVASYISTSQDSLADSDGTAVDFVSTLYSDRVHQEYAELIYTSDPSKPFTWVVGANYYNEHFSSDIFVPDSQIFQIFNGLVFHSGGTINTESYAAFGHAQYAFGPLKVFGGLRYSNDRKTIPSEFVNLPPSTYSQAASFHRLTYEAGLSYDFSPSITGYAKYATGYKSGGFVLAVNGPPFNPETDASYEAGLKGRFLDGALQANLSAFHMDYNNLQVNQILAFTVGVTNAARATVDGVELETVIRPTAQLRIDANGSWLNARFNQFVTADAARPTGPGCTTDPITLSCTFNLVGHQLPNAPHYTASLGVFYDLPVPSGTVTPGLRYDWKDKIYFSEFNIPISSQGAAGKLDLFVNYKSTGGRWTASLFALNVTDEEIKSNVTVVSSVVASLALGQYQPGRQVGVSIGYHF